MSIERTNKGFLESLIYYSNPAGVDTPDELHHEHNRGMMSFIIYYLSLMNLRLGVPSDEPLSRTVVITDNGGSFICSNTPVFTVNADLPPGFGVAAKDACSFVGASGVTVTDVRTTGFANPWCALVQTKADGSTYDIVGTKA